MVQHNNRQAATDSKAESVISQLLNGATLSNDCYLSFVFESLSKKKISISSNLF